MVRRYFEHRTYLKDLLASVVVFLVALPLAMGISIASGMPPAAGLITCIIGGLIVGPISGSSFQVSGPAAGLSVIVYEILQQHGMEKVGMVILIAGALQMIMGYLKLGQWFRAVSPAVVNGMLSGIGVLIFASQFHVMLDDGPKETGLLNLIGIPLALYECLRDTKVNSTHIAGFVGVLAITTILMWESIPFKKVKLIPSALIAVLVATGLTAFFQLPIKHVDLPDNLFAVVHTPTHWRHFLDWDLLLDGIGLALVASAETLLSATAVDRMQTRARTKYDKELFAQGVGNAVCGFIGALPMTGVIVRSSVNIQAGARTRVSAIVHGVWILGIVLLFPTLLRAIPTAALAALLVYTGYKLMNFKIVKELLKADKIEVVIYFVTLATIVATDLLTGVLTGVVLSVFKLLYMFSHLEIRSVQDADEKSTALYLRGAATFLNLPRLAESLESVPPNTELHVHLEELDYVDHASLEMIMAWEVQHKQTGGSLVIDWGTLGSMFRDRRRTPRKEGAETGARTDADGANGKTTNGADSDGNSKNGENGNSSKDGALTGLEPGAGGKDAALDAKMEGAGTGSERT